MTVSKPGYFADSHEFIWPTHAPFQRWTFNWFKPVAGSYGDNLAQSVFPYYGQRYVIDEHNKDLVTAEAIAAAEEAKRRIISGEIKVIDAMFQ